MPLPASQKGFTLIELVAVMVIIGALASVAVPKYYDLTREAQNQAALRAVIEGKARLSIQYARLFMDNGIPPAPANLIAAVGATTSVGDYTLNLFPMASSDIKINASGRGNVPGASSGVWVMPK